MAACKKDIIIKDDVLAYVSTEYVKAHNRHLEFSHPIRAIGFEAFYYCESPRQVTLSNSVTRICTFAFYNKSGMEKVVMHDSVTIDLDAFYGCHIALEITIIATEPSEKKAQALQASILKQYPDFKIHIENPHKRPNFFSQPSKKEDAEVTEEEDLFQAVSLY